MNFDKPMKILDGLTSRSAVESLKLPPDDPPHRALVEYHPSHRALIELAKHVIDDPQDDRLLSFSCAVYGWMPTILKNWDFDNFCCDKPVAAIKSITTVDDAIKFLEKIDAISPINRSWVGLSKLLHFMNPQIFPIWDSRVARHFGFKWAGQLNKKEVYIDYFEFVHENLEAHADILTAVARCIKQKYSYEPSSVRCLELLLFEAEPRP